MTALAVELEQDVVAAILLAAASDRDAGWRQVDLARAIVDARDFERPSLGALFSLLLEMRDREVPVDVLALSVELETLTEHRLEGISELVGSVVDPRWILGTLRGLVACAPPTSTLEHRARLVRSAAEDRREPR